MHAAQADCLGGGATMSIPITDVAVIVKLWHRFFGDVKVPAASYVQTWRCIRLESLEYAFDVTAKWAHRTATYRPLTSADLARYSLGVVRKCAETQRAIDQIEQAVINA